MKNHRNLFFFFFFFILLKWILSLANFLSKNQTILFYFFSIFTGVSDKVPVYTVKKDDGLDFIARTIFGQLLKYQKIVEANNISNPDLIQIGQNLTIPLPCSCDDVDNAKVVHYAHVVEEGSSFELIAQKFGTDRETLMKLNGIDDDSKLIAGEPLDVPLKGTLLQPFVLY